MVSSLDHDDVRHEVGSQQETQGTDLVRFLRFTAGQTELRELLVRSEHDQLGSKNNSAMQNN